MLTPSDFGARQGGNDNSLPALRKLFSQTRDQTIVIPEGEVYRIDCDENGGLGYRSGQRIIIKGKILVGRGWPSGHTLHPASLLTQPALENCDIQIRFQGGRIEFLDVDAGFPRKGICIANTRQFQVWNPTVTGGRARGPSQSLFSMEIRDSSDGLVNSGQLSVRSGYQGADGLHMLGNCSRIVVTALTTNSGDDAIGITHEVGKWKDATISDIVFRSCTLRCEAHSATKLLCVKSGGKGIIRDIAFENCDFLIDTYALGQGAPHIWQNRAQNEGAVIEKIRIKGGRTRSILPPDALVHDTPFKFYDVDDILIEDHEVTHFSPRLMEAFQCDRLTISNLRNTLIKPLRSPSPSLLVLKDCLSPMLDTKGLRPTMVGQRLISN